MEPGKMRIKNLILVFGLLFLLCSCAKPPFVVPDNEIVFQMLEPEWTNDKGEEYPNYVGFVNADGSDLTTFEVEKRWLQPTVSRDGMSFYYHTGWSSPIWVSSNPGAVSGWNKKSFSCPIAKISTGDFIYPMSDNRIVISNSEAIQLVDIIRCEVIDVLVDYGSSGDHRFIHGFSLSRDEDFIIYSEESQGDKTIFPIWLVDIKTHQSQNLPVNGFYPSLSPDDQTIAYVSRRGIEILGIQTGQSSLIRQYKSPYFDTRIDSFDDPVPPAPQWSPDGQWLIYHICDKELCSKLSDYGIYKTRVSNGEEVLIFQGGMYPYWIK